MNAVKMEVETLIENVEPELAACGAVMVAYVACASVFISLFLCNLIGLPQFTIL